MSIMETRRRDVMSRKALKKRRNLYTSVEYFIIEKVFTVYLLTLDCLQFVNVCSRCYSFFGIYLEILLKIVEMHTKIVFSTRLSCWF